MVRTSHAKGRCLRRFGLMFLFSVVACSSLFAQSRTGVPGMRRYVDSDFGFSFWYPTAWRVTVEPVADPTRGGWFPDATIVKKLLVRNPNPAGLDDQQQPPGVIVEELVAPAGLTELGHSKSASPVGVDEKYFFDRENHRWMDSQLSVSPQGSSPGTVPLKIERTMGGLPMWPGAARFGAERIVALDRAHFLTAITMDIGGDDIQNYLAETVVATHPNSGGQAKERLQPETIRREAVKLGAIGKLLGGYWYKDSEYVYKFDGEVLHGVNPNTFVLLPHHGSPAGYEEAYATEGVHVYKPHWGLIPHADPKTFVVTGQSAARDAHRDYDWSNGSLKVSDVTDR